MKTRLKGLPFKNRPSGSLRKICQAVRYLKVSRTISFFELERYKKTKSSEGIIVNWSDSTFWQWFEECSY